ncbi:hypothetical protein [Rudanella lutea]|uniref:hypothetical protein n=1 Tax=Rudanella lutea TaxID=451374 RepID=UPI00036E17EC|nr:hypothetical protein [Rudanella lutea]
MNYHQPGQDRPQGWGADLLHLLILLILLVALGYTVKRYQAVVGDPNQLRTPTLMHPVKNPSHARP